MTILNNQSDTCILEIPLPRGKTRKEFVLEQITNLYNGHYISEAVAIDLIKRHTDVVRVEKRKAAR